MAGFFDSNATDDFDNSRVVLQGGSDNTTIGNVGDRLKVDAQVTSSNTAFDASKNSFIDLNASVGGVARNTIIPATFTNVYSYTGSGVFYGFLVGTENLQDFFARVVVDGVYYPFFGTAGLSLGDVDSNALYNIREFSAQGNEPFDMAYRNNNFYWFCSCGFGFNTSITLQLRSVGGNRRFRAGFVRVTKDS